MSAKSARITIGLPVYNGENFIEDAVESILAQTYPQFRLIIADNASTDRTEEICRRYAAADDRIEYCRHPRNIGAARNFNFVFLHSDSEFFRWAAHDDVLGREYLRLCIERLDADRSLAVAHTRTARIDAERRITGNYDGSLPLSGRTPSERFCRILWAEDYFNEIWGVMRSEHLRQTRLYGSFVGSDRSLLAEVLLQGDVAYVPRYEFFRRDHEACFCAMRAPSERARWFDPDRTLQPGFAKLLRGVRFVLSADLAMIERGACLGALINRSYWRVVNGCRASSRRYQPRFDPAVLREAGPVPEAPPPLAFASLAGVSRGSV